MRKWILLFGLWIQVIITSAQTNESLFSAKWYCSDLDEATIELYKAEDNFYYAKIIKSNNAEFERRIIYKGKYHRKTNHIKGVYTAPSTKKKLKTSIYLDDKNRIRFVSKKYFITRTYVWMRVE